MTASDVFLERFTRFGASASVETYHALFHRDAELFDDGMERPLRYHEIPEHIAGVLALLPGFRMVPERWRTNAPVVMVEAQNEARLGGSPVSWRAVYRIVLEGDLVRRGRRYFDRAPMLRRLDPATPAFVWPAGDVDATPPLSFSVERSLEKPAALVESLARAWASGRTDEIRDHFREDGTLSAPGLARPLGWSEIAGAYAALRGALGGAGFELRSFAGDETLVFVEWEAMVPTPRGPHAFGCVERLDLACGRILSARLHFDASALARALAV